MLMSYLLQGEGKADKWGCVGWVPESLTLSQSIFPLPGQRNECWLENPWNGCCCLRIPCQPRPRVAPSNTSLSRQLPTQSKLQTGLPQMRGCGRPDVTNHVLDTMQGATEEVLITSYKKEGAWPKQKQDVRGSAVYPLMQSNYLLSLLKKSDDI